MGKRSIAVLVALMLVGILAPSAGAELDNSNTRYYVGKDEGEGYNISFVVRAGAVRETLAGGGPLRCNGRRTRIFKSWGAMELKGNAFQRTVAFEDQPGSRFTIAGHVRGATAGGRLRNRTEDGCDTGALRWQAERVSREEFKEFRPLQASREGGR